jgi:hypothetical protein
MPKRVLLWLQRLGRTFTQCGDAGRTAPSVPSLKKVPVSVTERARSSAPVPCLASVPSLGPVRTFCTGFKAQGRVVRGSGRSSSRLRTR